MDEIKLIRNMKWVKSVRKNYDGVLITTKDKVLKLKLTHYLSLGPTTPEVSSKMKKPIIIGLPSYSLNLYTDCFVIKLVKRPNYRENTGRWVYPTQLGSANSSVYNEPCLGTYKGIYENAESWVARARIAAEYLQIAIPDMGGVGRRSRFAYCLGLVGDEIIKK